MDNDLLKRIAKLLDDGCVIYKARGIIKSAKLPSHGSLIITTQDKTPVYLETRQKEKI